RSLKPGLECISTVAGRGEMLTFQEDQLPLIRLHELFAIEDAARDPQDAIVLLLENEGRRFGLLIDELIGQQQIVIRSLGDALKGTEGIAGAAILPDGTVGLVLDVSGIMKIGVDPGPGSDTRVRRSAA
ncbi:MAG TPA: chemotaxis protein CheW, partial [Candidatus Hydrogenedentes bacterium]|nr:chemotaxis protein CheW [Candidatus Hydrogenedentota bacterium]